MAPPSYAKVARSNINEQRFVQKQQQQQPEMSPPSKNPDSNGVIPPPAPASSDLSTFVPALSKKQKKRNNAAAKKDGLLQNNGSSNKTAASKPKSNDSDDFDFVIDAKYNGNNGNNENGGDKNHAFNEVENGINKSDKNDGINNVDKNDAINENGKVESAKVENAAPEVVENPVHHDQVECNGILDVENYAVNDAIKNHPPPQSRDEIDQHPPQQHLETPVNENEKQVEAEEFNKTLSIDNSSTDEEKNENENNHMENGHVEADVDNYNGGNDDGDFDDRGSSEASNRCTVEDFQQLLFDNSGMLLRMFGGEENFEKFKNFLKLMELSGGMELFCQVFDDGEEHQPLPNIDPQHPPLSELARLPREKLERSFRQLKKVMIQSYNARIFFPQFRPNPAAMEFHPHAQLSIISAPSAPPPPSSKKQILPHKIPTQKQIARRLSNFAAAKTQQQQVQHQQITHQQQLQQYIEPAHFEHQHQYFNGNHQHHHQQQQYVPPPPPPPAQSTALAPISSSHTPHPQQQQYVPTTNAVAVSAVGGATFPQYLQPVPYHTFQPSPLPLATTQTTAVDFAQYINHRNMALLDELRSNEGMLGNLLYTG